MSDFDARRRINGGASTRTMPRPLNLPPTDSAGYVALQCIQCNRKYKVMPEIFSVNPDAMTDKGYICPDCLRGGVKSKPIPTPPPKAVQIRVEDVMKGAAESETE